MTNLASLPEPVRRQMEEAEALEKQLYSQQAPEEGKTVEPEAAQPEPAPTPEPVEVVAAPEPEVRKEDEETYQQRYRVLQSKYDAEVPRLHAQLREATAQIQSLFGEVEKLRAVKPEPQTPAEPEKDNDAETFGEDLTEAIDRRAKRMAQAMVDQATAPMKEYISRLEAKLGVVNEQVVESAQDRFYNALAKLAPEWETINADQGFLNWLGEVDPVYGVPRQAALDAGANALDAQRAANVFNAYKALTSKQVQTQQTKERRQELERQVAPSSARGAASTPTQGKHWTRAEFEHAYDPRTIRELGQEKALQLQAEADLAYAEGRVQW